MLRGKVEVSFDSWAFTLYEWFSKRTQKSMGTLDL